jgi:hypothetical protein
MSAIVLSLDLHVHSHGSLLPNLTHLLCTIDMVRSAEVASLFVSRNISSLSLLVLSGQKESIKPLIDSLKRVSPPIRNLDIDYTPRTDIDVFDNLIPGLLRSFYEIERLQMDYCALTAVLIAVPALPKLTSLALEATPVKAKWMDKSVRLTWEPSTPSFRLSISPNAFPSLTTISIYVDGNDSAFFLIEFLRIFGATIEEISLEQGRHALHVTLFLELLEIAGQSCPSLRRFKFQELQPYGGSLPNHALRPLLACSQIEMLELTSYHRTFSDVIDDSDVYDMTTHWKGLQVLRLLDCLNNRISRTRPTLSLNAINMLSHCFHLHTLAITIDAEIIPETVFKRTPSHSLRRGASWVSNPHAVATWLVRVCPADGISSFIVAEPREPLSIDIARMWNEVKVLMRSFQQGK